jgi:hypothetical protein
MFGTDDNQQSNDDPAMLDNVKQLVSEPVDQVTPAQPQYMTASTTQPTTAPSFTPTYTQTPVNDQPTADTAQTDSPQPSAIAEPAQGFSSSPMPDPVSTPATSTTVGDSSTSSDTMESSDNAPISAAQITPADPNQLAGMKQEALDHLEPLVAHLDQTPEEAFKTTMMMIQANDNHTLLEKALDDAKKITDDKTRANAMLDIINEINYFSQNQ